MTDGMFHEDLYIGKEVDRDYLPEDNDEQTTDESDDTIEDAVDFDGIDFSFLFAQYGGSAAKSGLDELKDEDAIVDHDGRADTRTFFYPNDHDITYPSEDRRALFQRLIRHQEGVGDTRRGSTTFKADRERTVKTFCNQCDLTNYQYERVQAIVDSVSINTFGHYSTEHVILAAITLAANEDGRLIRDEHTFIDLSRAVGMDQRQLRRVRGLIRQKSDLF